MIRPLVVFLLLSSTLAIAAPTVSLDPPRAGVDFPTDTAVPKELANARMLVIGGKWRIAVNKQATLDGTRALVLDGKHRVAIALTGAAWTFAGSVRISLANIARIEHAVAGIDFPTDGPATLARDFYVVVQRDGKRVRIP